MKQMSGQDAAFLYGETKNWHMHVSGLIIIDAEGAPDGWTYQRFRDILVSRIPEVPQLRWRYVDVPFGLDRPFWIEEPDLDPDFHIRRVALPSPGGPEELSEVVGQLVSLKLDRSRPLWEAWVIEGLEGGRVAFLQKMHHAIIDGVSGAGLAEVIMDLEPTPRISSTELTDEIVDDHEPSQLEIFGRALVRTTLRTPFRATRLARQSVQQLLDVAPILRGDDPISLPLTTPRTILNEEPTARRAFSSARLDLSRVKVLKDAYGVKVNDVVLAIVASSLRNYLSVVDEVPESSLIVQCPVSLRSDSDAADVGNNIGSIFASLATDIDDPAERIVAIYESTQSAKEMRKALAARQIMGLTDATPPGIVALAARMYTSAGLGTRTPPAVSTIVSNVPGPDFPLYVAGGRVEALYPLGPLLMGMSLNVTVFSMGEKLDVGVMSCPDSLPDAHLIADHMQTALEELEAAARI